MTPVGETESAAKAKTLDEPLRMRLTAFDRCLNRTSEEFEEEP